MGLGDFFKRLLPSTQEVDALDLANASPDTYVDDDIPNVHVAPDVQPYTDSKGKTFEDMEKNSSAIVESHTIGNSKDDDKDLGVSGPIAEVKPKDPKKKKLTPKQRKLIRLQEKVARGEMTQEQAMIQAGYSESTAHQQQEVLGSLRTNTVMQDALRKAGLDEEFIAETLSEGFGEVVHGPTKLAYMDRVTSLLDVVPSKKIDKSLNVTGRVHLSMVIDDADEDGEDDDEETIEDEKDSEQDSLDVSKEQHAAS